MESQTTQLKNRYSIIKLLGRGGMGEVFLSEDTLLSRQVAVKKVVYGDNEYLLKAAEKEARVLARLQHQCLPKVLDYFNEGDAQYIVMEYIAGKDLGEMLRLNGAPFSTEQVWAWVDTLLDILDYLHSQIPPVVHRDIKPQNIKITGEGKLFLIDFGLVKDTPTRLKGDSPSSSVYGYSQSYAPLEQINGDPTSVQTDIYELCATLYHLLTNVKPADAVNRAAKRIDHKPDPLRPAHEVNPSVSPGLSKILEAGLQLSCEDRLRSVQALRQRFSEVKHRRERININIEDKDKGEKNGSGKEPELTKAGFLNSKPKRYAAIAGALLLLSLIAIAGYKLYQDNEKRQEAKRLFAEAQSIERAEGLLSQSACVKYNQIKSEYLDDNMRSELVKKSNSCTTVRLIFQAAEKAERDNGGLSFETIKEYKKIIESNPGSIYAKQAEAKVNEFERNAQATLKAYKAMQKADYLSAKYDIQGITLDVFKKMSQQLLETINLYGDIDLTNVDPLLSEHIRNSIETYKRGRVLFDEIDAERIRIESKLESGIRTYGVEYRDQLVKLADEEFDRVLQNNASRFQAYFDEKKKLDELDKQYASQLETKFNNKGFVDQY